MRFICVSVCCLIFALFAFAQGDRGSITGTVTDPAKAVVPNAAVVLRNVENASLYQTVITDTGNFTLAQLPSGTYELSIEAPGFSKFIQQGIRVLIAQTARVDVVLQVGS